MDLRNHIIILIATSVVLTGIFQLNSFLVAKYYIYFKDYIFLSATAWNIIYPIIIGSLSIKFISKPSNKFPYLLAIVPAFNIFILGSLIGGIEENINSIIKDIGLVSFLTIVQTISIVSGGFIGISLFNKKT